MKANKLTIGKVWLTGEIQQNSGTKIALPYNWLFVGEKKAERKIKKRETERDRKEEENKRWWAKVVKWSRKGVFCFPAIGALPDFYLTFWLLWAKVVKMK